VIVQAPDTPLLQASQQQQQALPLAAGLSADTDADSLQQQDLWQQQYAGGAATLAEELPLPEDARWLAVTRAHAAYLSYMQQLAAMAVNKQQQQHQLVYQVRRMRTQGVKLHSQRSSAAQGRCRCLMGIAQAPT
jgi:hypothetical protein